MGEAVCGKGLAGEGGDDRAVNHSLADIIEGKVAFLGGSQVTSKGAEEGIARAGGIGDFFERKGGTAKEIEFLAREGEFGGWGAVRMLGKQDGAEFTELNDHMLRAFI